MLCLKIYFLPLDLPFFRRIFPFCGFHKVASSLIHLGLFCAGMICTIYSAQRLLSLLLGCVVAPLCKFPTRKHCLFQDFCSLSPSCVSLWYCMFPVATGCWTVPYPVLRHPKYPGFVSTKLGEAQTCTVHHKVKMLGACPTLSRPLQLCLLRGKTSVVVRKQFFFCSAVWLFLNFSSPAVLDFVMSVWSPLKGFSGLCPVKSLAAWEQSVAVKSPPCYCTLTFTHWVKGDFWNSLCFSQWRQKRTIFCSVLFNSVRN